jgi:hypothetical protein
VTSPSVPPLGLKSRLAGFANTSVIYQYVSYVCSCILDRQRIYINVLRTIIQENRWKVTNETPKPCSMHGKNTTEMDRLYGECVLNVWLASWPLVPHRRALPGLRSLPSPFALPWPLLFFLAYGEHRTGGSLMRRRRMREIRVVTCYYCNNEKKRNITVLIESSNVVQTNQRLSFQPMHKELRIGFRPERGWKLFETAVAR